MSIAKTQRERKRQLGQFLTPRDIAQKLVDVLPLKKEDKVLEPSMGNGSFILPLIEKFLSLYQGSIRERLDHVLTNNVYGVEIDQELFERCLANIRDQWGYLPHKHNFIHSDFFRCPFLNRSEEQRGASANPAITPFTYIVGNPPFGGTLDLTLQDELDSELGFRNGEKIKKETYSFFIVKSLDLLRKEGRLLFICSDTFLTIKTMRGLRRLLMSQGDVEITDLDHFSDETTHPMVVLSFVKNGFTDSISVNGTRIGRKKIELTENFSWRITDALAKYFAGPMLGEYMVATSGMTVGKNEYFVRKITNGTIVEPYEFQFFDDPITLEKETARARLGKLSVKKIGEIQSQEASGMTRRNIRVIKRQTALEIEIPHPDYRYYNKGANEIFYTAPTHVIYWKDDGDAVLTFKKNGNWYLHGVGGQPYFKREGLTWQLIAQNLHMRHLPAGYILDSGAPCAFLRDGVPQEELYFILGWTLTRLCNSLLKEVINHTKNIQSKDFERLPYPFWVANSDKYEITHRLQQMVETAQHGKKYARSHPEFEWLEEIFRFKEIHVSPPQKTVQLALPIFESPSKKEVFREPRTRLV
jgi:hypothetical protein